MPEEIGEEVSHKPLFTRRRLASLRVVLSIKVTNECQNLSVVKPQPVSHRALVELNARALLAVVVLVVVLVQEAKVAIATRAAPFALLASTRIVERLRERARFLSREFEKHLELPGIEPGAFAVYTVINLDAFEFEGHEWFLTFGAHSGSFTSNEV
jgi:hypothetical protein